MGVLEEEWAMATGDSGSHSEDRTKRPPEGGDPITDRLMHPISRRQFAQRTGGTILAGSTLAAFLAACGSDDGGDGGSTTGEIGGTLSLRAYDGYYNKKAAADFAKENDVTIKSSVPLSPEEMLSSLRSGGGTSRWDAITTPVLQTAQLASLDLLQPLDMSRLPNAENYLPLIQDVAEQGQFNGESYIAPFTWGVNAAVYNEDEVQPTEWMDFTKPEYKGRIAMSDSPIDNYGAWGRVLGFDPPTMSQEELDEVTDFLVDFKKEQVRTFTVSYDDQADQLARGDIVAISNPIWVYIAIDANDRGGSGNTFTIFDEPGGGLLWVDGWGIPSEAENVDTAYAFINDQLGAGPQAIITPAMAVGTVNEQAVEDLPPDVKKRDGYLYDGSLNPKYAVPYAYPVGDVTYQDWIQAWSRVQAA